MERSAERPAGLRRARCPSCPRSRLFAEVWPGMWSAGPWTRWRSAIRAQYAVMRWVQPTSSLPSPAPGSKRPIAAASTCGSRWTVAGTAGDTVAGAAGDTCRQHVPRAARAPWHERSAARGSELDTGRAASASSHVFYRRWHGAAFRGSADVRRTRGDAHHQGRCADRDRAHRARPWTSGSTMRPSGWPSVAVAPESSGPCSTRR